MNKDYFDEYYFLERQHWWFKARLEIIQQHLEELKFKLGDRKLKILNVGAGPGATTQLLMNYGDVTSVEYDKDCIEMVKAKTGLVFEHESITDLPYASNSFDLVTAFDVVEHIEDDRKAVSELVRVCKVDGFIFTTVPTFQFMWSQHDEVNHHFRRYTHKTYQSLWNEHHNVQIKYSTYFNFFLFLPIAIPRVLSKILKSKKSLKGAGSDFTSYKTGWIDNLLYKIFKNERVFIKKHVRLPFGVSYLCSCVKINE